MSRMLKNLSARYAASAAAVTSSVCYVLYFVSSPPLLDDSTHQLIKSDGGSHQGRKGGGRSDSSSSSDSNWVVGGLRETIKFISGTTRKPRVWEREAVGGRSGEGNADSSGTIRAQWYYTLPVAAGTASITEFVSYPFYNAAFRLQLFAASPFSSMDPLNLRTSDSFKQQASSMEALEFMYNTVKTQGVKALWEGSSAVVLRQGMMAGGTLTLYSSLRGRDDPEGHQQYSNIPRQFINGGIAAAISQIIVNPLEVTRARIKADLRRASEMIGYKPRYSSYSEAMYGILKTQGVGGLFAGLAPSMVRSSLAYGAAFTTYDNVKAALAAAYPQYHHRSSVNTQGMSAMCSTVAFCAFYVPLDSIKGAMMEGRLTGRGPSFAEAVRGSVPRMVSGLGPSLHRMIPFHVTLFVAVEQLHQSVYSKPLFD